jgi:sugar lactone lactonase YvrE
MTHRAGAPTAPGREQPAPPARPPNRLRGLLVFVAVLAAVCGAVWFIQRRGKLPGDTGLGESFVLDTTAFMDVDPALVLYEEQPPVAVDVPAAEALAVGPGDTLYVAGRETIAVLDREGRTLRRIEVDGQARCLAVAPDGTLYAGVDDHVLVFDADGAPAGAWRTFEQDARLVCVALKGNDVYVADAAHSRVIRCDRAGRPLHTLTGFVLFSSPHLDIAVGPRDELWIVNPGGRELRRYDDEGNITFSWQQSSRDLAGFSGCCNPVHIAVLPDGSLVTSEKNIIRVKILNPDGSLAGVVAGPRRFRDDAAPLDLAVDSGGRILVLDASVKAVRVFTRKAP